METDDDQLAKVMQRGRAAADTAWQYASRSYGR